MSKKKRKKKREPTNGGWSLANRDRNHFSRSCRIDIDSQVKGKGSKEPNLYLYFT